MKNKKIQLSLFIIISAVAIFIDYLTKRLASIHLKDQKPHVLIRGVLELIYTENRGAAFGIMQGKRVIFFVITLVVIIAIIYLLIKMPLKNRFMPLLLALSFVFSGAIGNMIDRLTQGYVVDFIYFMPIDFPVFNVADIYVTCSAVALIIMLIFIYKDDDMDFVYKNSEGKH